MRPRPASNPPNPWCSTDVEWLGPPPPARPQLHEDATRRILSRNDSPEIGFRWSVNPYRGCSHGCAYCYARPTHEYLGFGAGTDFETRIVVKRRAPELLRAAFERPSWRGERVAFGTGTDCYQPLEAALRLTRGCLEACLAYRNPVAVVTKAPLIERDADVLAALARDAGASVMISLTFVEEARARALEPGAAPPARRLRAMERLAEAGVPVGVLVAPVIPGLNDEEIARILEAAAAAGARHAAWAPLRLPGSTAAVFEERLRAELPDRADRVLGRIRQARCGAARRGAGAHGAATASLFEAAARRVGLSGGSCTPEGPSPFRRPRPQLSLFA